MANTTSSVSGITSLPGTDLVVVNMDTNDVLSMSSVHFKGRDARNGTCRVGYGHGLTADVQRALCCAQERTARSVGEENDELFSGRGMICTRMCVDYVLVVYSSLV